MTPSHNLNKKIGEMLERFDDRFLYEYRLDPDFGKIKTDSLFAQTLAYDKVKAFIASEARKLVDGALKAVEVEKSDRKDPAYILIDYENGFNATLAEVEQKKKQYLT